jgi:polysaccharide deacetylase family protein (PEP-CTERM system associated)
VSLAHHCGDAQPRRHLLTVALEDYYHVSPLKSLIAEGHWSRFERRLEIGTRRTLAMLDEFGARATFFTLGWVADTMPELVREVADRGHEVASKGYYHRSVRQMPLEMFRDDLLQAREALERASGRRVLGYRAAERWLGPDELWVLDVLAQEGYRYDSSINPILRQYAREPRRRFAHLEETRHGPIWEFPISGLALLGVHLPVGGGNYFRQFPHRLMRRAVAHWDRRQLAPFVMYFHTWELDPEQPRISAARPLAAIRLYRNLDKMEGLLRYYLGRYRFQSVAERLELWPQPMAVGDGSAVAEAAARTTGAAGSPATRTPVSIVVPCYNESPTLGYLANTLAELGRILSPQYQLELIFVDDGSQDDTWRTLDTLFGGRAGCVLVRHDRNRGIAAAIDTGLRRASAEVVCSIDCDCSYDPFELPHMIPMLGNDVDLVTGSPYHSLGGVRNVQQWRMALSRMASVLYGLVLPSRLRTYTSCFRVYRRSAVVGLGINEGGYLGITELIGKLDLAGGRIVEYPTTLNIRVLGRSKMKVLRTIAGHLRLLGRFLLMRVRGRTAPVPSAASPARDAAA